MNDRTIRRGDARVSRREDVKKTAAGDTPLDQTTARVVSELAGQILPPLVNALDKSVKNSADQFALKRDEIVDRAALNSAIQSAVQSETEQLSQIFAQIFSDSSAENAERVLEIKNSLTAACSELSFLRQRLVKLSETVNELSKTALSLKLKNEKENPQDAAQLSQPVLDGLYSLSVQLGDFREAQRDIKSHGQVINQLKTSVDRLCDKITAELKAAENRNKLENKAENKPEDKAESKAESNKAENQEKLLNAEDEKKPEKDYAGENYIIENVKSMLSGLEGILRAHGHAQSRELEALSQELAAMQNQTGATMIQTIQDTARQEAAERDAEWEDRLEAEHEFIETRVKLFTKILWLTAGLCGGTFILSLIKLFY